ncbi:MAG: hypothetical protein ACLQIQ_01575 [Beijerinckiaceae bacterium]
MKNASQQARGWLASSLAITTIAGDVASSEQFELLKAAGCGQFRGSLLGPPRP